MRHGILVLAMSISRGVLPEVVQPGPPSVLRTSTIDNLYGIIMDWLLTSLRGENIFQDRKSLLQLSSSPIHSVLDILSHQTEADLSPLHSVMHISPSSKVMSPSFMPHPASLFWIRVAAGTAIM